MKDFLSKLLAVLMAIGLVTFVVSCQKQKNTGCDGYYFEKETFTRTDLGVHVVLVQSQKEMETLLEEHHRTIADGRQVAAFSVLKVNEPECTIYMIDPKISYQPEFIGHELVHCVYGDWHKIQP
jgi:hypothetical protein